jgi:integrase/recombinase XerD
MDMTPRERILLSGLLQPTVTAVTITSPSPTSCKVAKMVKAFLEADEVKRLEKAADNLRDRLLIRLLSHLGCRISEALGIAVEDIDLDNHTITIQHLKTRMKLSCPECSARLGKSHTYCPKCGIRVEKTIAVEKEHRRIRTLPIDGKTLGMVKDYISRGGPVVRGSQRLIFGINRHRGWQVIRDCAERAGLPKLINPETGRVHNVGPHKLRDYFSIRAVKRDDSGDGLRMLQEHLGHQSIVTTMRYRKVAGEELKTWYTKVWEEENGR